MDVGEKNPDICKDIPLPMLNLFNRAWYFFEMRRKINCEVIN